MFLDTSGLLCLHHRAEPFHEPAVAAYRSDSGRFTHWGMLAEFVALAQARRLPRPAALSLVADLVANPDIEIAWVDASVHSRAMALLGQREDKTYSLCDATSFVLMRDRGVTDALTTDRHFEQEGFHRLLGPTAGGPH